MDDRMVRQWIRDGWITAALLLAAFGHRIANVATVERLIRLCAEGFAHRRRSALDVQVLGERIHRIGTRLPAVACLEEAVVCHALLEAYGVESELHLGVTKPSSTVLEAHAWVTADEHVVVGDDVGLSQYTRLPLEQWP